MIKYFIALVLSAAALGSFAQSSATTSSPYSKYGLGDYEDALLPQNRGMGGIATGVSKTSLFNDINIINPASYSFINLTTIDIGAYASFTTLSQTAAGSQNTGNFRLSHIAFAIPVSKASALSFGIVPYTNLGYNYRQSVSQNINRRATGGIDTSTTINYVYSGEGGLSKAYLGYGFKLGQNLSLGFNVSYIFGNEKQYRSVEYPGLVTAINSSVENTYSAGGLNYDYGAQYAFKFGETKRLTLGYSGSANTSLNTTGNFIVSQYFLLADGTPDLARDSLRNDQTTGKITLPQINRFGISYQKDGKYLIGADYKMGKWSNLSIDGVNAGLADNQSFAIGGQITPDINSIHSYLAVIDYRLGFKYDNTYIIANGTNITSYGATFGLGLPIPNNTRTSFYKVNFSAEIGQRGTLDNNLVRETYYNFHLGFTINDKWFQKYKAP